MRMDKLFDKVARFFHLVVLVSVLAAPAAAIAADAEHADKPGLFTGDLGNIIWTLITFFSVVFVLGKFAWKPILSALQQREDFIRESLEQAKADRERAEAQLKEYSEKLEKAREDATAIVEEGRRDGEKTRKRLHADAQKEAEAMVARAKKDIALARDDAVKQLHDQTIVLAAAIAGKMLRRELDPSDHKDLLNESLGELGRMNN